MVGFTLQYEICTSNLLTMLDLGRIPLRSLDRYARRSADHRRRPLRQNPEPLAPFIDLFVSGDGEPSLPLICDLWKTWRDEARGSGQCAAGSGPAGGGSAGDGGRLERAEILARLAQTLPYDLCAPFL